MTFSTLGALHWWILWSNLAKVAAFIIQNLARSPLLLLVQCNLDLVTTCDLVTILQRPFFNIRHKIIQFSDIIGFSDSFEETKSVTKSRSNCIWPPN